MTHKYPNSLENSLHLEFKNFWVRVGPSLHSLFTGYRPNIDIIDHGPTSMKFGMAKVKYGFYQ
jgi:hypothetical protein